jgi:Tol biopolymer transport system component
MALPVPPQADEKLAKRACLERLLASPEFAQSGRLATLLRFLAENALEPGASPLKETVIGTEVFGREPGYDPKIDSVVRTEVRRLRLKLAEYYNGSGANDALRIDIPKGAYQVVFTEPVAAAAETPLLVAPAAGGAPPGSSRIRAGLLAVVGLAVCVALVLFANRWRDSGAKGTVDPVLITESVGQALHPSISADGKTLVYSYSAGENSGIYVMRLDGSPHTAKRIAGTRPRDFNPVISPAGDRVAYLREEAETRFTLLVQGLEDPAPKPWTSLDRRDRVLWLPDGKHLVASIRANATAGAALMRIDEAGSRVVLLSPPAGTLYDGAPALSPDGRILAFTRATDSSVDEIYVVNLGPDYLPNSQPTRITNEKRRSSGFCFAPDGKSIIASMQRGRTPRSLWSIPLSDPERLTRMPDAGLQAVYPTAAAKAGRIVYSVGSDDLNLYRAAAEGSQEPVALREMSATLDSSPSISPDGKLIAFRSARSGSSEIWVAKIDGSEPRRLTFSGGPVTGSPRWSPDGSSIAYDTRINGNADVYVMSADGKSNRRITTGDGNEAVPGWSHDGKYIYYSTDQTGGVWQVWKTAVDGISAIPRQVTVDGGFRAQESPDGKWLYYTKRDPPHTGLWRRAVQQEGGVEEPVIPLQASLWGGWALSASGLFYLDLEKDPRVMFRGHDGPTTAREVARIRNVPVHWDGSLDARRDGAEIVFAQLDRAISDLFLMEVR